MWRSSAVHHDHLPPEFHGKIHFPGRSPPLGLPVASCCTCISRSSAPYVSAFAVPLLVVPLCSPSLGCPDVPAFAGTPIAGATGADRAFSHYGPALAARGITAGAAMPMISDTLLSPALAVHTFPDASTAMASGAFMAPNPAAGEIGAL